MDQEEFEKLVLNLANEWHFAEQGKKIKDVLSAFAELRAERDLLLEALWAVPVYAIKDDDDIPRCQWCERRSEVDHTHDCLRQRALGITKGE